MGSLSNNDMKSHPPFHRRSKSVSHGKRLLPQILDNLAAEDPEHVIGMIAKPGTMPNLSFTSLSSSQMANAVNFTSYWLHELLDKDPYKTIAFIGLQDYRYWIMTLAAIKTGHPLLLASPRNAISNNVSLLNATSCEVVFYSGGGSPLEVHVKGLQSVISGLRIHEIPSLEQMITVRSEHYPYNKTFNEASKDTVLLLHTSGSTGNPKPIRINNAYLSRMDSDTLAPLPPGKMLAGLTLARRKGLNYLGAPLSHLSGVYMMGVSLFKQNTNVLGPVDQHPSGEVGCAIVRSLKLNAVTAVPFIQQVIFGENGEELKSHLMELDHICSFGGPLSRATATWIEENLPETILWQCYGSTENQLPLMLVPPRGYRHCIDFHPTLGPDIERISPTSELYELVFRRHPDPNFEWAHPVFEVYSHLDEWRPGDLFRRCQDEGFEYLWEFQSRIDDIIIMSNGAKVNPLHLETKLMDHPALRGCLMFGEGHTACGMLLESKGAGVGKDELLRSVWPAIEEANLVVPERARVLKSLIVVAGMEKPLTRSAKGTLVRKSSLKMYEVEIQKMYKEAGCN